MKYILAITILLILVIGLAAASIYIHQKIFEKITDNITEVIKKAKEK